MIEERLFPATTMPDADWWQALWPDPDRVVQALHIRRGMTVVDLGCGPGYFTAAIARCVGDATGQVIGLDLDPAMLEAARVACEAFAHCR